MPDYPCRFSRERLIEMRHREGLKLSGIAALATVAEIQAIQDNPVTEDDVRRWFDEFGLRATLDKPSIVAHYQAVGIVPTDKPAALRPSNKSAASAGRKTCPACGQEKRYGDFSRDRNRPDGMARICLECNEAKSQDYYQRNREKQIARSMAYKAKKKETTKCP